MQRLFICYEGKNLGKRKKKLKKYEIDNLFVL